MEKLSSKNNGKILAVAGNQTTTVDVLQALLDADYSISYLINVGSDKEHMIADYIDLKELAQESNIQLIRPVKYVMNDPETQRMFDNKTIDALIVVGWQRLIPEWLLQRFSIGAFGMHGSSQPLPRGRGRSPMVWSILEDRNHFLTNLFRYDPGVDSGMIVATQRFDINPWDTIRSLQHKNALSQVKLLVDNLPDLLKGTAEFRPQPDDVEPTYYPKRVPEDGVIDWRENSEKLYRLVRAVTRPYPGAFTVDNGEYIYIWQGTPFDQSLNFAEAVPGEIGAVFYDQTFVVKCGDHSFYVTDWEAPEGWCPHKGLIFESRPNPSWGKLTGMYSQVEYN